MPRPSLSILLLSALSTACFSLPSQAAPTWTKVALSSLTCPSGYIPVPAFTLPSGATVPQFCVMKYEAKKNPSTAGNRSIGGATGALPISVAAGLPWTWLTWQDARSACAAAGMHLITDNQWLSIAHQVTSVASNWSGGAVGNGFVYTGHSDNTPTVALAADSDDANGYYGTGDGPADPGDGGFTNYSSNISRAYQGQRRTLSLPNGQVIWDLVGNVWEYVSKTIDRGSQYQGGASGWMSYNSTENGLPVATNMPLDMRPPNGYNAIQGMGRYFEGDSTFGYNSENEAPDYCVGQCAPVIAFSRGSCKADGMAAGPFTVHFYGGRDRLDGSTGFRCVK